MGLSLEEIKKREEKFALKRGFHPQNKKRAKIILEGCFHKLVEETGEVSNALLREDYKSVSEELADILIYCVKINHILEKFYKQKPLDLVVEKKMEYNEKRKTFDRGTTKIKCPQ